MATQETPASVSSPVPFSQQVKEINFVGLYTMFYRKETNHLQTKNFRFNGNLQQARERADSHCKVIGGKLMFVQPLISDLSKEEDFILKGKTAIEGQGEKE